MRVEADMPARVWKLVVRSGTEVFHGDEMAVLESMKMELRSWWLTTVRSRGWSPRETSWTGHPPLRRRLTRIT